MQQLAEQVRRRRHCPFCYRPVVQQELISTGGCRFIYRNDCSCLEEAQGEMQEDGTIFWHEVKFRAHRHAATPQQLAAWERRLQYEIDVERER